MHALVISSASTTEETTLTQASFPQLLDPLLSYIIIFPSTDFQTVTYQLDNINQHHADLRKSPTLLLPLAINADKAQVKT
jgi:hypothetical protein